MTRAECVDIIYAETMRKDGFMWKSREGEIREEQFTKLIEAIKNLNIITKNEKKLDKLSVACLFSAPYELENTVDHYKKYDVKLGKKVSQMSEELNEVIQDYLWDGLEEYYME